MPRVHTYIRVSTKRQAQEGFSLEAQRGVVKSYAQFVRSKDPDLKAGKVLEEEGESAYRKPLFRRRQGRLLLAALEDGDHLVLSHHDRCFRSMKDFSECMSYFEARNITLHFANIQVDASTSVGRLILHVMISIAQYESEANRDRVAAAKAAKKSTQRYRCTGWIRQQNGEYTPIKSELKIMRLIAWYKDRLGWSFLRIGDRIEELLAKRDGRKPTPAVHFSLKRAWPRRRVEHGYRVYRYGPEKAPREAEASRQAAGTSQQKAAQAKAAQEREKRAKEKLDILTRGNML